METSDELPELTGSDDDTETDPVPPTGLSADFELIRNSSWLAGKKCV